MANASLKEAAQYATGQDPLAADKEDFPCKYILLHCPDSRPPRQMEKVKQRVLKWSRSEIHVVSFVVQWGRGVEMLINISGNRFNGIQNNVRSISSLAKIYKDLYGVGVNVLHLRDLASALMIVSLVYAKCINPKHTLSVIVTQMFQCGV